MSAQTEVQSRNRARDNASAFLSHPLFLIGEFWLGQFGRFPFFSPVFPGPPSGFRNF